MTERAIEWADIEAAYQYAGLHAVTFITEENREHPPLVLLLQVGAVGDITGCLLAPDEVVGEAFSSPAKKEMLGHLLRDMLTADSPLRATLTALRCAPDIVVVVSEAWLVERTFRGEVPEVDEAPSEAPDRQEVLSLYVSSAQGTFVGHSKIVQVGERRQVTLAPLNPNLRVGGRFSMNRENPRPGPRH